jgi:hypothetical protein
MTNIEKLLPFGYDCWDLMVIYGDLMDLWGFIGDIMGHIIPSGYD